MFPQGFLQERQVEIVSLSVIKQRKEAARVLSRAPFEDAGLLALPECRDHRVRPW